MPNKDNNGDTAVQTLDSGVMELYERLQRLGTLEGAGLDKTDADVPTFKVPKAIREQLDNRHERSEAARRWTIAQAKENRKYYLNQSIEQNRPWFQCVKQDFQYSEFVLLDPDMAADLMKLNTRNRITKQRSLQSYRRDVSSDRWVNSHESIGIDLNGEMFDGQHRSEAVIQEKKPTIFYFTFNVDVAARAVVDSGIHRSTTEKLYAMMPTMDNKLGTKLATVSRVMMRGLTTQAFTKWTDQEVAKFAHKYQDTVAWAVRMLPKIPAGGGEVRADVHGAIAKCGLKYGQAAIEPFCAKLRNLQFTEAAGGNSDPAKALFLLMGKAKKDGGVRGVELYCKTLRAIQYFLDGKPVYCLHPAKEDVFEFDANWEVPTE